MGSSGLFVYGNDPDRRPPPGVVMALKLRRVLPIAESCTITEGELTLTSLELYDDGSILNYFIIGNDEVLRRRTENEPEMQRLSRLNDRDAMRRYVEANLPVFIGRSVYLRMQDDLGSTYDGLSPSASGGENRWETSYGFTPAVPLEAKRLRVQVFEGDWQRETGEATKRDPEHLLATIEVPL
jgi:hypothetical protein